MLPLLTLPLRFDEDVVSARRAATELAAALGFDTGEQTRIATAVSEVARNAFRYGGGGIVLFEGDPDVRPHRLRVRIEDHGPGIPDIDGALNGTPGGGSSAGFGLVAARRLMDRVSIESSPQGTQVVLEKFLPATAAPLTASLARDIAEGIRRRPAAGLVEEIQRQNEELLAALDELQRKQAELTRLNRELEETNRGVVALYAELDEKADHLRRADDMKSRFLSNMTHEFRTPVNAILGLCNLLRDDRRRQGREPEPEVEFITKAADQLWTLVNDLLDLAQVDAGKVIVRPATLDVQELFGTLRGMLRPLLLTQSVALVFEDASDVPCLVSDEAKVSQILRNLISNGLKFTERGEVRVSASADPVRGTVTFQVADTGIGIAPDDQAIIFEEFEQIESQLQGRLRGTGLGLPLSRRLAELLGGSLTVTSEPGLGSVFSLSLPLAYRGAPGPAPLAPGTPEGADAADDAGGGPRLRVLVIDDDQMARYMVRQCLPAAFDVIEAVDGNEGIARALADQPDLIILDLMMPGLSGQQVIGHLRRHPATAGIPILVATGGSIETDDVQALRSHVSGIVAKRDMSRATLQRLVRAALPGGI